MMRFAGSTVIPHILYFCVEVLKRLNYKSCFWGLVAILASLGAIRPVLLVILGAFLAIVSTYGRQEPPFTRCTELSLDVLLGKSTRVSTLEPTDLHSNNNVSICTFRGKYVLAYRKSDTHFPSGASRIIVATSEDLVSWTETWQYHTGNDLRETLLFEMNGVLFLYFFSLVPSNKKFKPISMYCITSKDAKVWTEPVRVCRDREVPWDIKVRKVPGGPFAHQVKEVAYKASYHGDHYGTNEVFVLFEKSTDGLNWEPVGEDAVVYTGGVSEVSFEFTSEGDLVAIGRNEDGDASGFGSQLFHAGSNDLGRWRHLRTSLPWRFDSPRLVRTSSGEILLFSRYAAARYDLAPRWLSFNTQKTINLITYSLRPKSAAIFRIISPDTWPTFASSNSKASPGAGLGQFNKIKKARKRGAVTHETKVAGDPEVFATSKTPGPLSPSDDESQESQESKETDRTNPFKGGAESLFCVELVRFFEQAFGDTGFFSLAPHLSGAKDKWVVANYSSNCHSHAPWIFGQLGRTDIYVSCCCVMDLIKAENPFAFLSGAAVLNHGST